MITANITLILTRKCLYTIYSAWIQKKIYKYVYCQNPAGNDGVAGIESDRLLSFDDGISIKYEFFKSEISVSKSSFHDGWYYEINQYIIEKNHFFYNLLFNKNSKENFSYLL